MTRIGILGATALSLSFAIATPVLAQQQGHGGRAGGGAHAAGGNMGGARMGGGQRVQSNMGAQANVARGNANFARGNGQFARGGAQFAQGDRGVLGGGQFRGDRGRGFGSDVGFGVAAGVATGAAIAAGGYGYGYDQSYDGDNNYAYDSGYGDSYAYDNGATYNSGLPLVTFDQQVPVEGPMAVSGDASYCAQRYRSYDPASGTYLGFDGMRHPCQ
jgi:BA14K-like protein